MIVSRKHIYFNGLILAYLNPMMGLKSEVENVKEWENAIKIHENVMTLVIIVEDRKWKRILEEFAGIMVKEILSILSFIRDI